jgi:hypothetical protein
MEKPQGTVLQHPNLRFFHCSLHKQKLNAFIRIELCYFI